jgi:hypothetical protein
MNHARFARLVVRGVPHVPVQQCAPAVTEWVEDMAAEVGRQTADLVIQADDDLPTGFTNRDTEPKAPRGSPV